MPHLIVFSHLRWDFVYQRPQHLLSRLAKHYPVVFIEEPIRGDGPPAFQALTPNAGVTVLKPQTPIDAFGFDDAQLSVLQPLVVDYLQEHGIDDYIVWFYTPMALPLLEPLRPRAVVYDCMDELAAFKHAPPALRQREAALIKAAQLVVTGGPSLYEAKRHLHPNVLCLPSAVDAGHYAPEAARAHRDRIERAEALQGAVAHPRFGFFGVVDERLDIELIARLADAETSRQIVMVGPIVKIDPAHLPKRSNLHWLGQQPYEQLPQLVAGWDVCLLPFALNESTRFISPTKTLEYLAAEKPVVSTRIHDVEVLYGDAVRIADTPEAFATACQAALDETEAERAKRIEIGRRKVAEYSWDRAAETVHAALEHVLDEAPPEAARAGVRDVPSAARAQVAESAVASPVPVRTQAMAARSTPRVDTAA